MKPQLYEISTISKSGVIQFNRISADDDQEAIGYLDEWLVSKKVMNIPYRDLGAVFKVFTYPSMRLVKIRVPEQFKSELTETGEQLVIPGCEAEPERADPQGSLW